MTATYIALATITLTSTDSEIVFSSIPATFRDLVLVMDCSATSGSDIQCIVNGVTTTASYSRVFASGDGSGTFSMTAAPTLLTFYGTPASGLRSNHIVQFMDYNQTNKHKTYLTRSNRAGSGLEMVASRFASTNAVTQIAVSPTQASFQAGSTFSLYGIN